MLSAGNRLRESSAFSGAVKRGRRTGGRLLVLHIDPAESPDAESGSSPGPRVGLVVSRAVGNAVVRNRVKRRLRHLLRTRLDRLPPAARVVVRAQAPAAQASYQALGAELDRLLSRWADSDRGTPARPTPTDVSR